VFLTERKSLKCKWVWDSIRKASYDNLTIIIREVCHIYNTAQFRKF